MTKRIAVVDGNQELRKIYGEVLGPTFAVTLFRSSADLVAALGTGEGFDLVITEIDFAGESLLAPDKQSVWSAFGKASVLVVTHVDDIDEIGKTMRLGADDYLTKPFNHNELIAKCLRLTAGSTGIECDAAALKVLRSGSASQELTANEFKLMTLLSRTEGGAIGLDVVAEGIWGQRVSDQRIHTMLSRLRPKVSPLNLTLEVTKSRTVVLRGVD